MFFVMIVSNYKIVILIQLVPQRWRLFPVPPFKTPFVFMHICLKNTFLQLQFLYGFAKLQKHQFLSFL